MITCGKKTQSGRSMIEMLGVLAIVGILSAGGIAGYSMAMQSYKTSALIEKINLIATQTRNLYKSGVYTGASIQNLKDAGRITDNNNPFGGEITMPTVTATNFTLQAANVPAEACVDLLAADWGSTGVFTSVTLGSDTWTRGAASNSYPPAVGTAITKCKGTTKTLSFIFK
jgi:prepilin-type N-terminal cleavage/methylation domain-containing protein